MIEFENERKNFHKNKYLQFFDQSEVDEFIKNSSKNLFSSWSYKNRNNSPLVQPRGGISTFEKQYELYSKLVNANVDILPLTIDSHTRLNDYEKSIELAKISEDTGENMLNGYPLIYYGHKVTRKLNERFQKPISLRHGTPDARLLVELAIASGIFEIEGGPITYVLPYSKSFPLDKAFLYWQYIEKLCVKYSRINEPITRESFGPLTATLVPPAITIAVEILEMLLSVSEGITSFSVSFSQTGSFIQDIAITNLLRTLSKQYLSAYGINDPIDIYIVYHQWMGAFPKDKPQSNALIDLGSVISSFINADKIIIKTQDEAFGIPSIKSNAAATSQTKYLFNKFSGFSIANENIEEEQDLIEQEVNQIMEAVLNYRGDTLWRKIYNSIKDGIIDIPFSPHIINSGKLTTLRDSNKNIRIHNPGSVPVSSKLFKKEKQLSKFNGQALASKILDDINCML